MTAIQIAMPVMFGLQAYVEIADKAEYNGEGYAEFAEQTFIDPRWEKAVYAPWADDIEVEPSTEHCPDCGELLQLCVCPPF